MTEPEKDGEPLSVPPDYTAFLARVMDDRAHSDALNTAAAILSGQSMPEMIKRTGGDPYGVNDLIDAQIDALLATCDGEPRFALWAALAAYGSAMYALSGPPGSKRHT